jgi:hypothetical protein
MRYPSHVLQTAAGTSHLSAEDDASNLEGSPLGWKDSRRVWWNTERHGLRPKSQYRHYATAHVQRPRRRRLLQPLHHVDRLCVQGRLVRERSELRDDVAALRRTERAGLDPRLSVAPFASFYGRIEGA